MLAVVQIGSNFFFLILTPHSTQNFGNVTCKVEELTVSRQQHSIVFVTIYQSKCVKLNCNIYSFLPPNNINKKNPTNKRQDQCNAAYVHHREVV